MVRLFENASNKLRESLSVESLDALRTVLLDLVGETLAETRAWRLAYRDADRPGYLTQLCRDRFPEPIIRKYLAAFQHAVHPN